LNLVQTIPSIALFGLLMAALAWLGAVFPVLPAWGIHGIGLAPAVLALTLYSLLPLVRSVVEGLANVPVAAVESAHAMGMVGRQRLWHVELPLAAPVILSGLKVMLVQTIGLAAVAALIGAGGLGALMFEGLFSSALDLVVLAVAPLVVLAWCAEALFAAMAALFPTWIRR
jgi:osmoprotectant transport system permease protein